MITYRYLSDGTKVSAEAVLQPEIDEGNGYTPAKIYRRRYKGSFTYVTDPDTGEETLESIAWNEGMIYLRKMAEPSDPVDTLGVIDGDIVVDVMDTLAVLDLNNRMIYDRWFVKDHLGNVRTVVELGSHSGEIVEQDDYLPFGTRFTPATQGVICTMDTELYGCEHDNRYRYAGKEEQRFGQQIDLALLDFGARAYDPFTARWTSIDPLAHKYLGFSPYNYCGGNPVMYFDPDGMDDYSVNKYGKLELVQPNFDPYDRLTIGNRSLIIQNRSLLSNFNTFSYTEYCGQDATDKASISYTVDSQPDSEISDLFYFLADNTNVEWLLFFGEDNTAVLATNHKSDSFSEAALEIATKSSGFSVLDGEGILKIHNHPDGYANERDSMIKDVRNMQNSSYLKSFVYFPKSGNIYQVSKNGAKQISRKK